MSITGCVASLYLPTENDAQNKNTTLAKLQEGRTMYLNSCGSCHNLHLPSEYTLQEWTEVMSDMQKRAKINDTQKETILLYLGTNSKKP